MFLVFIVVSVNLCISSATDADSISVVLFACASSAIGVGSLFSVVLFACTSSTTHVSLPSISSIIGASTMSLIGLSSKAISSVADADPIAKIIKSRIGNIKNFLPIMIIPKLTIVIFIF